MARQLISDIGIVAGILIIVFTWLKYKAEKRERRQGHERTKKVLNKPCAGGD